MKRLLLVVCFLSWVALGAQRQAAVVKMTMQQIIQQLHQADAKQRREGLDQLDALVARGLTNQESVLALTAGLTEIFPAESPRFDDAAKRLIDAASTHPTSEGFGLIQKGVELLTPPAKTAAIEYLLQLKTPQGVRLFSELYIRFADQLDCSPLLGRALTDAVQDDALIAALVETLSHRNTAATSAGALLDMAEHEKLPVKFLASRLERILAAYRPLLESLTPPVSQKDGDQDYRWQKPYRENLGIAEYFPDLLGYAGEGAEPALRESFAAKDPRISYFAVSALLRLKRDVPQEEIDRVAADDEMRNLLFDTLEKSGMQDRFPKQFRTQEAFARSEMVRWLVYPTELDRAPNDIELMKTVDVDTHTADGVVSIYLFRFRTKGDHWAAKDGWMAGIAGGYLKANSPTTHAGGQTFSTFKKYDSLTPDQHVQEITSLIEEMWKKEAKKGTGRGQ